MLGRQELLGAVLGLTTVLCFPDARSGPTRPQEVLHHA
jgi:hypothetical protein